LKRASSHYATELSLIKSAITILFMPSSTSFSKISFEESLHVGVVKPGKCQGCRSCVVVCPFGCLEYLKGEPVIVKECKTCGICAAVCPTYDWASSELEKSVFGRERKAEEEFGIHRRLVIARAKDRRILGVSQDGGVVTALLVSALKSGLISGAAVSGISSEKPFLPVPKLATTVDEIYACSGTRYFYSPNILALAEAVKQKKEVAFVGTPCQIRAVRKMRMAGLKKYADSAKFLVGLMCSECFGYDGLMEKHISETLHVDPHTIKKMNIKGKMIITASSGVHTTSLAETKQYARKSCRFCADFSSELADISLGGLGLDGWTFAVIRTERGQELFENAERKGAVEIRDAEEEPNALSLLHKLSKKKRGSTFQSSM
jgi:coenzyme F420 hydrogenase subunit beta